ncbi:DNA-binding response regulator [Acrocarpospora phusangensis]|uniref:DNA-binding response regulator n=1 Tax=Acrocarpospora phusangensis TaxID=1070424 RepID=A0A919UNG2_9ACTN|nr:response regulator transcription factor [Acrocarpospora phusangensis]GIH24452.1 DNA-binding response regulator [Acrocarpospora phusangensis]
MRVVIVEDNVLLAEGLALLLRTEGHQVAATVGTADAFLAAVEEHRPDIAVVDVRLPPAFRDEGVRAAVEVRRRHPAQPILVLSQYVEQTYATELLAGGGGGIGYLLKDRVSRVSEFVDALARVAAGGTAMDPEVIAQLLTRRHAGHPVSTLSPREAEVLGLMAEGRSNGDIAALLTVTERAVHKHVGNIFMKLGLPPSDSGHRRVLAVLSYLSAV